MKRTGKRALSRTRVMVGPYFWGLRDGAVVFRAYGENDYSYRVTYPLPEEIAAAQGAFAENRRLASSPGSPVYKWALAQSGDFWQRPREIVVYAKDREKSRLKEYSVTRRLLTFEFEPYSDYDLSLFSSL